MRQISAGKTSRLRALPAFRRWAAALLPRALLVLSVAACDHGDSPSAPRAEPDICGPFGAWQSSPYALPYPVGTAYYVNQANCSGFGHSGFWSNGYDFLMPLGTTVTAARSGVVVHSLGGAEDGDRSRTNLVTIEHDDGTVALYSHLTRDGNLVEVGELVAAGESVGRSGDTGNTGGVPHLHFSVHPCSRLPGLPGTGGDCSSIAVNFRNTDPNPQGLEAGRTYPAGGG